MRPTRSVARFVRDAGHERLDGVEVDAELRSMARDDHGRVGVRRDTCAPRIGHVGCGTKECDSSHMSRHGDEPNNR